MSIKTTTKEKINKILENQEKEARLNNITEEPEQIQFAELLIHIDSLYITYIVRDVSQTILDTRVEKQKQFFNKIEKEDTSDELVKESNSSVQEVQQNVDVCAQSYILNYRDMFSNISNTIIDLVRKSSYTIPRITIIVPSYDMIIASEELLKSEDILDMVSEEINPEYLSTSIYEPEIYGNIVVYKVSSLVPDILQGRATLKSYPILADKEIKISTRVDQMVSKAKDIVQARNIPESKITGHVLMDETGLRVLITNHKVPISFKIFSDTGVRALANKMNSQGVRVGTINRLLNDGQFYSHPIVEKILNEQKAEISKYLQGAEEIFVYGANTNHLIDNLKDILGNYSTPYDLLSRIGDIKYLAEGYNPERKLMLEHLGMIAGINMRTYLDDVLDMIPINFGDLTSPRNLEIAQVYLKSGIQEQFNRFIYNQEEIDNNIIQYILNKESKEDRYSIDMKKQAVKDIDLEETPIDISIPKIVDEVNGIVISSNEDPTGQIANLLETHYNIMDEEVEQQLENLAKALEERIRENENKVAEINESEEHTETSLQKLSQIDKDEEIETYRNLYNGVVPHKEFYTDTDKKIINLNQKISDKIYRLHNKESNMPIVASIVIVMALALAPFTWALDTGIFKPLDPMAERAFDVSERVTKSVDLVREKRNQKRKPHKREQITTDITRDGNTITIDVYNIKNNKTLELVKTAIEETLTRLEVANFESKDLVTDASDLLSKNYRTIYTIQM